jgi:hypothetical protein
LLLLELESAVAAWLKQSRASNISVVCAIVREKPLHIFVCLGADNFVGLNGWVEYITLFVEHKQAKTEGFIQK